MADRRDLLERYARFYGRERFAVAFTASVSGDDAKRVTSKGWDRAAPLATADFAAGLIANRGLTRNVAIVLRPSNLVVLECDSEQDLARIAALNLPETITVQSSKPYKRHFYFRPPPTLEALPYVAFRFESGKLTADAGRYFLAPPSVHPSGIIYAFLAGHGPEDLGIATLPEAVYRQLSEAAHVEDTALREQITVDPGAKIRAGNRRDFLFRYACMLRRWGLNRSEILEATLAWNETRCDPPVEPELVAVQVDGAMKKRGDQEIAAAQTAEDVEPQEEATTDEDQLPVETWHEFEAKAHDRIPVLVARLWPEAAFGFIAAPPKKGKTWIALTLAASVATGRPFLGSFHVPQPRPVLYVALEGHRAGIRARVGAVTRGLELDPDGDALHNLHWLYKPAGMNLADPVWAQALHKTAGTIDAALIVIDVLRAGARIKENDQAEFSGLRHNLQPLTDDGRSIALLHHFGKLTDTQRDRDPGERMSGTGAMFGALDVALYITGSDDGARKLRLEFDTRDIAAPEHLSVQLQGHGSGENGGYTYLDTATWRLTDDIEQDDLKAPPAEIAQWLKDQGGEARALDVRTYFGISDHTLTRRLSRLTDLNVEYVARRGKPAVLVLRPVEQETETAQQEVFHTSEAEQLRTSDVGAKPHNHAGLEVRTNTPEVKRLRSSESGDLQDKPDPRSSEPLKGLPAPLRSSPKTPPPEDAGPLDEEEPADLLAPLAKPAADDIPWTP